MLTLRAALPSDIQTILSLIRDLAEYEQLLDQVDANEITLQVALFNPQPRVFCNVAEWSNSVVPIGFALWFYNFSTFRGYHGIYLEDLYVQPEFRGRGIGKALLIQLAQRCIKEKLTRLEWAVLDWNEPALKFYRSLGAKATKEWLPHRVTGKALQHLASMPLQDTTGS
ncbi:MAG: GNAT family N-acetyltransferase [Gammaproteobacteria bacterium]|nr:GNAT family N-acetyltransferase [Gammaproteobacteria bacterium]